MPGPLKLGEIASRLGGRLVGSPAVLIEQVGSLEHAGPRQIAFYSGPRYRAQLAATRAGAVILPPAAEQQTSLPRIVSANAYADFARVSNFLNPAPAPIPGVTPCARCFAPASACSVRRLTA